MPIRKITIFTGQVLVLALVSAIGFSQTASAAPCSAEIDALKIALEGGICLQFEKSRKSRKGKKSRKNRKCKGLNRKLDRTTRKLEKGKFSHAARKLSDFGWAIEDMAMRRKPKISMDAYEALMDPYYLAVANCISNGGISTPPVVDDTDTGTGDDPTEPPPLIGQF